MDSILDSIDRRTVESETINGTEVEYIRPAEDDEKGCSFWTVNPEGMKALSIAQAPDDLDNDLDGAKEFARIRLSP